MSQQTLTADQHGNFDSPALQSLQSVWDDYESEAVEADEVLRVIGNVEAYVSSQIDEMEKASEVHDPNREAILDGFYDHLRGLELMRSFFDSDDEDRIEEGFEVIQAATNLMVRGLQGLVEEAEMTAPKTCIRCQRENEQQATCCRRCGAILPVLTEHSERTLLAIDDQDDAAQDEDEMTTPNFIEVSDAHQVWLENRLSDQGLIQHLETVRERQRTELQRVLAESQESAQNGGSQDDLESLEGLAAEIERSVQALDAMAEAVRNGDRQGAQEALASFAEATIDLLAAQAPLGQDD